MLPATATWLFQIITKGHVEIPQEFVRQRRVVSWHGCGSRDRRVDDHGTDDVDSIREEIKVAAPSEQKYTVWIGEQTLSYSLEGSRSSDQASYFYSRPSKPKGPEHAPDDFRSALRGQNLLLQACTRRLLRFWEQEDVSSLSGVSRFPAIAVRHLCMAPLLDLRDRIPPHEN